MTDQNVLLPCTGNPARAIWGEAIAINYATGHCSAFGSANTAARKQ